MRTWNRPLLALTGAMVLCGLVGVAGLVLDPRELGGQPIWAKPVKFSVSIALYGATLAWMISLVTGHRARRIAAAAARVAAACSAVEMVAIVGQVVRGRPSHFDVATPFDTVVWGVMAAAITTLWLATAAVALVLLRERAVAPATGWAVRLGLLVALLGMAVAALMTGPTGAQIARAGSGGGMPTVGAHAVGAPDGGPGLPLLGWSTTGGDLRVGHFVGLHALQALPLTALALALLARRVPVLRTETVRARLVIVTAAAWAGLTLVLTGQALRARPLLAPDAPTLAAGAALVIGTALAAGTVLARARFATGRAAAR